MMHENNRNNVSCREGPSLLFNTKLPGVLVLVLVLVVRSCVLVRRSAATSALGRSAAVRERLLLRWSAEKSSEMTTST